MQYDLTKVHEINLKILKEIDRICRKYKIKYMLDGGTLLGAVRHKGFIPWDDDADIAFTRNNYEAFLKVVKRELPDTMELLMPEEFQGGKAFFDFTARVIYKNSRRHEDSPEVRYYEGQAESPVGGICLSLTSFRRTRLQQALPGCSTRASIFWPWDTGIIWISPNTSLFHKLAGWRWFRSRKADSDEADL